MSAGAEALARQIAGAREIAVVVRSMKALAASSINQYEQAVLSLDDYYRTVQRALIACAPLVPEAPVTAIGSRSPAIGIIIFGSDQGLVGRFNEVLWEFTQASLQSPLQQAGFIWVVGDRMQELVAEARTAPSGLRAVPISVGGITSLVDQLLLDIESLPTKSKLRDIHVFHNRPQAGATYQSTREKLLPLDVRWLHGVAAAPWPNRCVPQVLSDPLEAIRRFTQEHLFVLLFRACAQSLCAENASRLAAMQRAERNIDELRSELNRRFQRVRQEAIDEELFDVIAGSGYPTPSQNQSA
jgi:F-type H+-transporting ATPase subunit gamma